MTKCDPSERWPTRRQCSEYSPQSESQQNARSVHHSPPALHVKFQIGSLDFLPFAVDKRVHRAELKYLHVCSPPTVTYWLVYENPKFRRDSICECAHLGVSKAMLIQNGLSRTACLGIGRAAWWAIPPHLQLRIIDTSRCLSSISILHPDVVVVLEQMGGEIDETQCHSNIGCFRENTETRAGS